jgi:tetratricopeptide (TPR) repeat protein
MNREEQQARYSHRGVPMNKQNGMGWKTRGATILFTFVVAGVLLPSAFQGLLAQEPGAVTAPPQEQAPAAQTQTKLTLEDRADIFMARKEYSDAVDYYLRAMKMDKTRQAAIWNKLGIAYQQQSQFRSARNAYKKAIHFQKDFPEPWNNLGTTYFLEGRAKKSLKYYKRAVKLNPSNASFHLNLGTAYFRSKKYDEAVGEYRAALTLNPNILREHSPQGTVVEARGSGEKLYFYLAKAFASLGLTDEAVRYLRRAFEEGFHDVDLLGKDPDFQKISSSPAYVELLKNPPVAIKE